MVVCIVVKNIQLNIVSKLGEYSFVFHHCGRKFPAGAGDCSFSSVYMIPFLSRTVNRVVHRLPVHSSLVCQLQLYCSADCQLPVLADLLSVRL